MARRALLLTIGLLACNAQKPPAQAESTPTASEQPSEDPMVGYDLRRLRPRDDEPLAAMFERVRTEALRENKRVAVLFSADWCEPCRHLDLELGNTHPQSMIGDVRVLELKEEDWVAVARMDEFNSLRRRWEPVMNTYPLLILLDNAGGRIEEMKEAKERLEAAGLEPTLPVWFDQGSREEP
jgi:thiol-disulfide isomerase/thioredoxin